MLLVARTNLFSDRIRLAFVASLSVAGLTIYTATVEKSREYVILKVEEFTNRFLYRVVFEQSLVTSALGFVLGTTLLMALIAASIPVRRLAQIGPVTVFKG